MSESDVAVIVVPSRIKSLPFDEKRGFYVPWFVAWIDGKPEFRVADGKKKNDAIQFKKCWVCGQEMGRYKTFVVGPMCVINKISGDPPSHTDCAEYSAKICPFLVKPNMIRRRTGSEFPEGTTVAGEGIMRNPGVSVLWTTVNYRIFNSNGYLFDIGNHPTSIKWFCEGREATTEEIMDSINSGCPALEKLIDKKEEMEIFHKEKAEAISRFVDGRKLFQVTANG